jgi:hypothetical protein
VIAWVKRPGGELELLMPCESGLDEDNLRLAVDPLSPVTPLGPQSTVTITEQGAGSDPDDGSPCEAVATITLTAAGLRRLAAACGEAADELDRIGYALSVPDSGGAE